ncbi:probable insulin-like peptide 7 [Chrysoperla carnea]|uniref:probable insulin-like peptide 7 n=1 Tax=Chrysoperla carnea TaxID=189513 RepID=UPI001D0999C9|nr:probable insulin-like peptide 7 [Chrysoperla carnea]
MLCFLVDILKSNEVEDPLEKKFRDRSESEWKNLWHDERHAKCRHELVRHMYWACEKDIYRLVRRNIADMSSSSSLSSDEEVQEGYDETDLSFPWLRAVRARRFIRWRRNENGGRRKRSITAECCDDHGCTWEEYAEYCPFKRQMQK